MYKKIWLFLFVAALLLVGCSDKKTVSEKDEDEIIILYTANVNCEGDKGLTYAGVSAYKKEMEESNAYVTLIDAGNYLSGELIGAFCGGCYATELMNCAGYDIAVLGKKEFYFDTKKLLSLKSSTEFDFISCNFIDESSGKAVFEPYKMLDFGDKKVAFIGVSNPTVENSMTKDRYLDESGSVKYSFCQDEDGSRLYEKVQENVDAARAEGADYVFVLSSLGENDFEEKWDVRQLIVHTTGIDVVIDGGSRNVIESEIISDKNGAAVLLSEPGAALAQLGKITIKDTGITAELIDDYKKKDTKTSEYMVEIIHKYQESAQNTITYTDFDLVMKSADGKKYFTRCQETNLGDLCADAYREVMGADISLVDAGSIAGEITDNDITLNDIEEIFPYDQQACLIKATGKMVMNALELGASQCPYSSRNFLQVSGVRFEIDTNKMPVVVYEDNNVAYISEDYRVKNVQVLNRETEEYEPIDFNKEYLVAMSNYMYKGLSGTFTMFQGCEPVLDEEMSDAEVLLEYLEPFWNMKLPQSYSDPNGDGRIFIKMEK